MHVWWAQLDEVGGAPASSVLSPAEQDRAERILPGRRRRWVDSRMLLRAVLGRYLDLEPGRVELASGAHGKPHIAACTDGKPHLVPDAARRHGRALTHGPLPGGIDFSLSHSRGSALLAIARDRRVGVDLELLRAVPKAPSLVHRALGAEHARELAALPRPLRDAAFLRLWTRHEAELKCAGTGLLASDGRDAEFWTLELPTAALELPMAATAAATLALDSAPARLRLWRWPPGPTEPGSEDADGDRLRERRAFVDGRQDDVGAVVFA